MNGLVYFSFEDYGIDGRSSIVSIEIIHILSDLGCILLFDRVAVSVTHSRFHSLIYWVAELASREYIKFCWVPKLFLLDAVSLSNLCLLIYASWTKTLYVLWLVIQTFSLQYAMPFELFGRNFPGRWLKLEASWVCICIWSIMQWTWGLNELHCRVWKANKIGIIFWNFFDGNYFLLECKKWLLLYISRPFTYLFNNIIIHLN